MPELNNKANPSASDKEPILFAVFRCRKFYFLLSDSNLHIYSPLFSSLLMFGVELHYCLSWQPGLHSRTETSAPVLLRASLLPGPEDFQTCQISYNMIQLLNSLNFTAFWKLKIIHMFWFSGEPWLIKDRKFIKYFYCICQSQSNVLTFS